MEAYNLPIKLREWFVQRLLTQKKNEKESMEKASKGKKSNAPQALGPGNAPPGTG